MIICNDCLLPSLLKVCVQIKHKVNALSFVLLQCSVSCGEGEIVRQVICFNYNHQRTSDHQCNAAIRPETSRKCQASVECPTTPEVVNKSVSVPPSDWRTGPWTQVQRM